MKYSWLPRTLGEDEFARVSTYRAVQIRRTTSQRRLGEESLKSARDLAKLCIAFLVIALAVKFFKKKSCCPPVLLVAKQVGYSGPT